ncbi:ribosomal protein S7 [Pseudovirgaria hyperparasitica]|uniref:Ribosomal protein S7 n=1 Tax=Pseudovirgaria hyperparasitica TaxID=470096 RepID=A0A6A6VW16_9PEZI|nr:ribosomal protein S7 [Pseudovirgaria hyperparasitica]KAF2753904.1 ribosomal protein S7 [Pseudovirgaria hyperparasitica]
MTQPLEAKLTPQDIDWKLAQRAHTEICFSKLIAGIGCSPTDEDLDGEKSVFSYDEWSVYMRAFGSMYRKLGTSMDGFCRYVHLSKSAFGEKHQLFIPSIIMTPRINLFSASRSLVLRSKPSCALSRGSQVVSRQTVPASCRSYAESKLPKAEPGQKGMNEESLPHVSEEAAAVAGTTGGTGPDLSQGTPVEEAVKGEQKTQDNLPKVMQQEIKQANKPSGSRPFSTSARQSQLEPMQTFPAGLMASSAPPAISGFKFEPVQMPIPREQVMKYRYHDVVEQVTNHIMIDGKKSQAQRHVNVVLERLSLSSPPVYNPSTPLLPGTPPPSHLPLNPILYMTLAIDAVAPLVKVKQLRGLAGGGRALQMPIPLSKRVRRRIAIGWIISAATSKKGNGANKDAFGQRLADEMIAVVEGKSSVWQKRLEFHKMATTARANVGFKFHKRKFDDSDITFWRTNTSRGTSRFGLWLVHELLKLQSMGTSSQSIRCMIRNDSSSIHLVRNQHPVNQATFQKTTPQ